MNFEAIKTINHLRFTWNGSVFLTLLLIGGLSGMLAPVMASESAERFLERDSVREYIRELSVEHQLDSHRISDLFSKLKRQQSVLDAISRPAERTLTWREYRPIFITQERISGGVQFLRQHKSLLKRAEDRFGVPAEVITAIIGVETYYGRISGSYSAVSYTHLRAHETVLDLVCRLLLEKKK